MTLKICNGCNSLWLNGVHLWNKKVSQEQRDKRPDVEYKEITILDLDGDLDLCHLVGFYPVGNPEELNLRVCSQPWNKVKDKCINPSKTDTPPRKDNRMEFNFGK